VYNKTIGLVAYEIALPPQLANSHNVFHVSQLRKYVSDPTHVLEEDEVQIRKDLTLDVGPMRVLDVQIKQPLRKINSYCQGALG